ncbi:hypothetical protein [Archangium violaceum]|uniref:hypothetical protein n=1 Tax=Archangium violaceum TaxID=83451 RepID=UPI0037C0D6E9
MENLAEVEGTGFEVIGGLDRALEFAAVELSFYFWQYWGLPSCPEVPAPDVSAAELLGFVDHIVVGIDELPDLVG